MAKAVKLDNVGWCERCLRPFDRPKPGKHAGSGWRICDDCMAKTTRAHNPRHKYKSKKERKAHAG